MSTKIDHDGWSSLDLETDDTKHIEEKRYYDRNLYAPTNDTIEMTQTKVLVLFIDEKRVEQENDKDYKNIRKTSRNWIPAQFYADGRGRICRTVASDKT